MWREVIRLRAILSFCQNLQVRFAMQAAYERALYRDDVVDFVLDSRLVRQTCGFFVNGFDVVQVRPARHGSIRSSYSLSADRSHRAGIPTNPCAFCFGNRVLVTDSIRSEVLAILSVARPCFSAEFISFCCLVGAVSLADRVCMAFSVGFFTFADLLSMCGSMRGGFLAYGFPKRLSVELLAVPAFLCGVVSRARQASLFSVFRSVGFFGCAPIGQPFFVSHQGAC